MATKYWLGNDAGNEGDYSVAANWSPTNVPIANDSVIIIGTQAITGGLDQSLIELDDFIVDPSYTGTIGSATASLQIDMADTDRFEFSGRGKSYIDVGTAAINPIIKQTASASSGQSGLYLTGSAIATLTLEGGSVELAAATVTAAEVRSGATLTTDTDSTVATILNTGGTTRHNGAATTIESSGGSVTINGTDALTTVKATAGTVTCNTSGTVTNAQALETGTIDFTKSRTARTVTNAKAEGTGQIKYDPNVVTMTNAPTGDASLTIKAGQ